MTPLKQLFRQPVRLFAIFLLVGMASAFICLSAGVFASAKATLAQIEERYVTIGVPTTETADVATEYNGLTLHHEESVYVGVYGSACCGWNSHKRCVPTKIYQCLLPLHSECYQRQGRRHICAKP